jgi:uncharacterized membrane protein
MVSERVTTCPVCGEPRAGQDLVPGRLVRPALAQRIILDHPGWAADQAVCTTDLRRYQLAYIEEVLERERGELSDLDREVLDTIREGETLAQDVDAGLDQRETVGNRVADQVAAFGGSWMFIILFFLVIAGWIAINLVLLTSKPFDPYPFILLNLVLSCLAAIQAPVIMMSQNRKEAQDRARSEHDYQVNLKAELEIRLLHEKLDHLIIHQWQRLLETQQLQAEMLAALGTRLEGRDGGGDDASPPQ